MEKDRKMQLHIKKVEHHREIEIDDQSSEGEHRDEVEIDEIIIEAEVVGYSVF
jgi:hypothetical protein